LHQHPSKPAEGIVYLEVDDRKSTSMEMTMKTSPYKRNTFLALLVFLGLIACGDVPIDDSVICCKLDDGTVSSETTSDCEKLGGNQVEDELCECDEEVCCELDDGTFQTLPESECANIAHPDRCLDVSPAEEVCCKTADGYLTLPDGECPDSQTVADELCIEDEEICCKMDDGTFQTLLSSECPETQTVDDELCIEDEDVCCETAIGYQTLPASECPDGQVTTADMCVVDEDVCCEMSDGTFQTLPASQCDMIAQNPDRCLQSIEELCCRIDGQFVNVPADQCPEGQEAPADMCVEDEEVCCETADGLMTLPSSECPDGQEVAAEMCEAKGECTKFRAVDMSTLPYTTTDGDTLQSFNSFWGTFPVQTGWSSPCLDHPAGAERAAVGVGNDLVLNFAAPVSSIYLLRYHAQSGDDLVVPGANLTPTSCGASSYNNITRVDLPTPSSSVTVQDISPDGGSGYSVLLAECIEWAQN